MTTIRKPFEKRFNALWTEKLSWEGAWKDIQSYICPSSGFFDGQTPNDGKKINHQNIIDGHATRQLEILASGMTSGLTSPSRPWFKLGLADPELMKFYPVKEWLDDIQQRMLAVFAKSNIYGVFNSVFYELGGFGTASFILAEDYKDVIRGRNFTAGEYCLSNGPDGRVNGFARKFNMTIAQLVEEFGKSQLSEQTRARYERGDIDGFVEVRHLIEVNDDRVPSFADAKGMPFRSAYWEIGAESDTFLRMSGFHEFPVMGPRWKTTTTADVYGRGPGWNTLGDVKMLQKMRQKYLQALDKVVDPPVQHDSSVDDVNLLPGGLNESSMMGPNAGVRPVYQINPDLAAIAAEMADVRRSIASGFFADLFLMLTQMPDSEKTAREIVERHDEKLLVLGPVLDKVESEGLDPTIDRTFAIMMRAGLLPPPPEEIQDMDLKIEYISPLAQAQKMVGTTAIEQTVGFVGSMVAVYPEAKDLINPDEAVRHYSDMTGVPAKIIRSDEELADIRQKRQEAQDQAAEAARAGAMVGGAKVLSDTKIGQNSALDAVIGQ